jgi:hypothetical protein
MVGCGRAKAAPQSKFPVTISAPQKLSIADSAMNEKNRLNSATIWRTTKRVVTGYNFFPRCVVQPMLTSEVLMTPMAIKVLCHPLLNVRKAQSTSEVLCAPLFFSGE